MRRVHSLRFDSLEARELLAKAHVVAHVARPAPTPLVLDGTLAVDNLPGGTSSTTNVDGSTTVSVRVTGQFGALGAVEGTWNTTEDSFGDGTGPDTLRLHDAKGSFLVVFNNMVTARPQALGHGAVAYEYAQHLYTATGPYAGGSETGSIELISNKAQSVITGLALHTRGT